MKWGDYESLEFECQQKIRVSQPFGVMLAQKLHGTRKFSLAREF